MQRAVKHGATQGVNRVPTPTDGTLIDDITSWIIDTSALRCRRFAEMAAAVAVSEIIAPHMVGPLGDRPSLNVVAVTRNSELAYRPSQARAALAACHPAGGERWPYSPGQLAAYLRPDAELDGVGQRLASRVRAFRAEPWTSAFIGETPQAAGQALLTADRAEAARWLFVKAKRPDGSGLRISGRSVPKQIADRLTALAAPAGCWWVSMTSMDRDVRGQIFDVGRNQRMALRLAHIHAVSRAGLDATITLPDWAWGLHRALASAESAAVLEALEDGA